MYILRQGDRSHHGRSLFLMFEKLVTKVRGASSVSDSHEESDHIQNLVIVIAFIPCYMYSKAYVPN